MILICTETYRAALKITMTILLKAVPDRMLGY